MIRQQPPGKDVTGVARDQTSVRPVVEIRVRGDALIEALGRAGGEVVHGDDVARDGVVGGQEEVHIHGRGVARDVEVVARVGRVGLDPVVAANETAGFAWQCRC